MSKGVSILTVVLRFSNIFQEGFGHPFDGSWSDWGFWSYLMSFDLTNLQGNVEVYQTPKLLVFCISSERKIQEQLQAHRLCAFFFRIKLPANFLSFAPTARWFSDVFIFCSVCSYAHLDPLLPFGLLLELFIE